jgi:corrinoid protein of di/trimethylamine methyltransferase
MEGSEGFEAGRPEDSLPPRRSKNRKAPDRYEDRRCAKMSPAERIAMVRNHGDGMVLPGCREGRALIKEEEEMSKEEILKDLKTSVETWNIKLAESATKAALDAKLDPKEIIEKGLGAGMEVIGEKFDKAEIYLPQVIAASKSMEAALKILAPVLQAGNQSMRGTVIMGTVQGDIHEIGKNVCCAMLRGAGYNVIDLGPDVSPDEFMASADTNKADIIGGSALMTTTLQVQAEVVEAVKEVKAPYKTIFGGAPCTQEWCDKIGASGYSENGAEIIELVNRLMKV